MISYVMGQHKSIISLSNIIYIIDIVAKCTETHPFSYFGGKYCCQYGVENILPGYGDACSGGPINRNSVCCKDHAYIECPFGVCTNRGR